MTERDIFLSAIDIPDPQARQAFLARACGDNAVLRRAVDGLLAAHAEAGSFMEPPPGGALAAGPVFTSPLVGEVAAERSEAAGGGASRGVPPTRRAAAHPADLPHQGGGEEPELTAALPPDPPTAHPASPLAGEVAAQRRVGGGDSTAAVPAAGVVGSVVAGRYKLLEVIGEGGMGTVFMADQTEPVRRRVAVKLVRDDRDSRAILARFEAERQAIAVMDHPHIAKLLDAGATDGGRPFFVMELVRGVPITTFCDAHRLTVPDRLRLFQQVCSAVQHAHQKGVIHRDLKPSNVLVESHDGKPVPKVIDFGLAKAAGGLRLTDATLFTGFGAVLGTPQYMAPEQATFNAVDIDTRADVYALGVILYELLAGSPPLGRETLKKAALEEMLRAIREDDPPPPSSRIGGSAERPSLAANRQTEPDKLGRFVRGELDWIVMKALAKDRDRRYDTATAFGADVGRFLNHEPVAAGPPGAGYRLRKFVARNRGPVAAAAAVLLALTVGIAGTTTGLVRAERARTAAETAEQNERDERVKADAARKDADEQRKVAERTAASLEIDAIREVHERDPRVALLQMARTARRIPSEFQDLREFAVVSCLAWGQQFTSFLPPITHDGQPVVRFELSSDDRTRLTHGSDGTLRLWDTASGRPIAVIGRLNDSIEHYGFCDRGLVYTDHVDGVVRYWDAASGKLQCETPAPLSRYRAAQLRLRGIGRCEDWNRGRDRIVTWAPKNDREPWLGPIGVVRLWDTSTGQVISRLDRPGLALKSVRFVGDRWVVAVDESYSAHVFSAADGQWLARLDHPQAADGGVVWANPTNQWLVTWSHHWLPDSWTRILHVWDTKTWQPSAGSPTAKCVGQIINYLTDDLFAYQRGGNAVGLFRHGQGPLPTRFEATIPFQAIDMPYSPSELKCAGDRLHDGRGRIYDTQTWQLLAPPSGRRCHPDLAKFAPDGRFLPVAESFPTMKSGALGLFDTKSEKLIYTGYGTSAWTFHKYGFYPWISWSDKGSGPEIVNLARGCDIDPELVELWAQVVARGELGPDGRWVKWDEPAWDRRRLELAARPAPHPDFPFPGHIVTDPLYWLREDWASFGYEDDGELAGKLLRRAEALGDQAGMTHWRRVLEGHTDNTAPPPRPVNRP